MLIGVIRVNAVLHFFRKDFNRFINRASFVRVSSHSQIRTIRQPARPDTRVGVHDPITGFVPRQFALPERAIVLGLVACLVKTSGIKHHPLRPMQNRLHSVRYDRPTLESAAPSG